MVAAAQETLPDAADAPAPREWWQVLAERRTRWLTAHPRLARAWTVTRMVVLFGSLVWLAALWLFMPELRLGMRAYLGCLWVVIAWFALARTKTLTWHGFLGFFTVCVPWSAAIGALTTTMATSMARYEFLAVSETGAQVAIAGIVEEAGKLAPVVLLALLAPRRAARFATIDWLLLGLASGTAFLAVEEAVRRTALATGNIGLGSLLGPPADAVLPPGYVTFGLIPIPTPMSADGALLAPTTAAEFGGHAILTALITGLFGLALAAWQARRRLTGLALGLLPAIALWSAIADHAMYNAGLDLFSALPGNNGAPAYLDPDATTLPWWLRVPWSLLGHGHGRVTFFLLLALTCLLVDAARLATRPPVNLTGRPAPRWVTQPVNGAHPAVSAVLRAVTGLLWIIVRDLAQALAGFARRRSGDAGPDQAESGLATDPESRRAAAARGAALISGQRALRELAYEDASARIHPWARRLAALAVLAGLGWLVFAAAPATAREIGSATNNMFELPGMGPTDAPPALPADLPSGFPSDLPTGMPTDLPTWMPTNIPTNLPSDLPTFDPDDLPSLDPDFEFPSMPPGTEPWLAGALDAVADWWHDQPLITQLAIGAGIAALVVLSGGSLGLALGISGVLTWGLDHSAGIATFTRNPRQATRDYFATATPAQLAADTLGVALTFAPGNFAGAATGRILRNTADDLAADPAAWWATRRRTFTPPAKSDAVATTADALDDVAALAAKVDADSLTMTNTVANHFGDVITRGKYKGELSRPYMNSSLTVREIMAGSDPRLDPRGAPGALRWDTPGKFRGRTGTWELVVDTDANKILHFNFVGD
ncbi:PT domain-containing protein [Promicromonospora sp. NPDC023805]|uniref:PT domain-containing protein n=1 Tax=Promicromonospora sp. NPDC023805 TaxID=3154696 RepID=UPI0033CA62D2